ncbi:MAG: serine--tRNA ligase, partial [Cyclobacteriaceae bacterium]|nr:serine--tRNA ligase [Cyclobacteriaceae bacterium]
IEAALDSIINLDNKRKDTQRKQDDLQAESNTLAREIGNLMKSGNKEEAEKLKKRTSEIKEAVALLNADLTQIEADLQKELYALPNVPAEKVPAGKLADDNITVHTFGNIPELAENALPHWELIKKYDIIDFDLGIKISGAGFPVYKGKGAKLQRALINFFLDEAEKQGYREIQPPIVVNEASGYGTGQLPDKEGQMYHALPVKNVGYTPCFRREAGSWGAHVRGLNRLHQFDKVEIVQIRKPEESEKALDEMCLYVQSLLEKLELPYRKLLLCGGDMGVNSAITYDMEVYSAAQKRWLEVSSVSNFETFQANRLKLRYKNKEGKTQLLHTLNGSALALPRIVAAILENNQTEKGIRVPKILQAYTRFEMID